MPVALNNTGESDEWALRPSLQQRRLDYAALFVGACLLFVLLPLPWWFAFIIAVAFAFSNWHFAQRMQVPVERIGRDARGWWILVRGHRRAVRWRSGSIRRYELVRLQWGFWPWQHILVRADSFVNDADFRRLRCALYAQI
jgi:toxin CptA